MFHNENFIADFEYAPVARARVGRIVTPHGEITTPNFVFCGTKASVKCVPTHQVREVGAEIILANTYHLMVNPGADYVQQRGGLHKFMNWEGPMLTDSGGYQVFAMGHGSVSAEIKKGQGRTLPKSLLKISEDGVSFRSYLDGSCMFLSPEVATMTQQKLGADLFMQFDECTPFHVDKKYTAQSMRRSLRWGQRCIDEFSKRDDGTQAMYGIVQGGVYEDLRRESVFEVNQQNFWGTAIGGSLGENRTQMHEVVEMTAELLGRTRPIHLLGIGDIPDIFWGVRQGIDTFDCVHPTRIARHACAIVPAVVHPSTKLNLKNQQYRTEDIPMDENCTQMCCQHYTRAYINYLFKAKELLGMYLVTLHNIAQMVRLMKDIQTALKRDIETQSTSHYEKAEKFWMGGKPIEEIP